jgi:hypothetical protein
MSHTKSYLSLLSILSLICVLFTEVVLTFSFKAILDVVTAMRTAQPLGQE